MKNNLAIIPYFALFCLALNGCSSNLGSNDKADETSIIFSTQNNVVEAEKRSEFDFLAPSYSLEELGYSIIIPREKTPYDPYLLEKYKSQGATFDYESYHVSNIKATATASGRSSIYVLAYGDDFATSEIVFSNYMAFKESDFDFSAEQVDEKVVFNKKLVKFYPKNGNELGKEGYYVSFRELYRNHRVYSDGEIFICDVTPFTLTYGVDYDIWIKNIQNPEYVAYNPNIDYDYSWILDFKSYLDENIGDLIVKI